MSSEGDYLSPGISMQWDKMQLLESKAVSVHDKNREAKCPIVSVVCYTLICRGRSTGILKYILVSEHSISRVHKKQSLPPRKEPR